MFARAARLGPGSAHEEQAWAIAITEKVNQVSESTYRLWTPFASPGVNTLIWTTMVEDLATLEATNDKLLADSGYHMLLEQGARYASGDAIDDVLLQIVDSEGADQARPPAYVAVVDAVLATGAAAKGLEVGLEITKMARKITNAPVTFCAAATGAYGHIAWHTGFDSITELQRGQTAIAMDPNFMQYLDKSTPGVYQPAARQSVYRRVM